MFPRAKMQLCIYHVIQTWHRKISTQKMRITGAEKNEMLDIFTDMLYARTEAEYLAAHEKIRFTTVKEYFDKNWHPLEMRKQWATLCTDNLRNYLSRTTNRIESVNQKLKTVVTKYGKLDVFIKETRQCVNSLNLERDCRTIASIQKKPVRPVNETPTQFKYRSLLTQFAYQRFLEETKNINKVKYFGEMNGGYLLKNRGTSPNVLLASCNCRFRKTMSLPCRHMFFFLEKKGMNSLNRTQLVQSPMDKVSFACRAARCQLTSHRNSHSSRETDLVTSSEIPQGTRSH